MRPVRISENPMMEFSGDRSSWLKVARNFFSVSLASIGLLRLRFQLEVLHAQLVDQPAPAHAEGEVVRQRHERISSSVLDILLSLIVRTSSTPWSSPWTISGIDDRACPERQAVGLREELPAVELSRSARSMTRAPA